MKNLFKNLMLVAVAAMTFASCQNDNENLDINVVSKAVNYTFTADFGETRAIFGELDGESYPVTWEGTETFGFSGSVLDTDGAVYDDVTFKPTTTEFSDDLKKVSFTVTEFEYSWITAIADNSVVLAYTSNNAISYGKLNVDGVQKPTATSVDSDFIGLIATFEVEDADTANFKGTFEHATAYGKLNIPVVEGVEFETVKITLSDDNSSKSYELDVTGLEEQSYWFACEPAVVNKIAVMASGSGKLYTYEKSFEEGSELTFTAGHVKPLTIKGDLVEDAPYYAKCNVYGYEYNLYIYDSVSDEAVVSLGLYYDEKVDGLIEGEHAMMVPYEEDSTINGILYWYNYAYVNNVSPEKCQLIVEYLDNGYGITFNYIVGGKTSTISYEGRIEGIWNPGDLKSLATPEVSASANGNAITLSWDAVANAVSYTIFKSVEVEGEYGYEREYVELETVNSDVLTYTITDLEFNTEYTFGVQANAAQGDTNYKNSNIAGVTTKTTFDFNNPDYAIVFTNCVVDGNVYQFSNNNGDEWTLTLVNPLAAGTFVQSNWSNAYWSGNDTTINIASAQQWYDGYIYNGTLEVTANGDEYTIVMKVSAGISGDNVVGGNGEKSLKLSYTGSLGGSNEPEEVAIVSAVATTPDNITFNPGSGSTTVRDVTFTYNNGDVLMIRFATLSKDYIVPGTWQTDSYTSPNYINLIELNGEPIGLASWITPFTVGYESDAYTFAGSIVVSYSPFTTMDFSYTGAVENLVEPVIEEGGESGGDQPGDGDQTEDDDEDYSDIFQDGTQEHPYIYKAQVDEDADYWDIYFTCEADGGKPLYLSTENNLVSSIITGPINSACGWYGGNYDEGRIDVDFDNSNITVTKISNNCISLDEIALKTSTGFVYYKCPKVLFE